MHIGMFTDTYEPKIDGIVSSIKAYTAELTKRGHTVQIYSPKNSLFTKEIGIEKNIHNTRIPSLSYYAYPDFRLSIPYDPRLISKINKEKFDVIHTHTPGSIGILGICVAKLFGIRAVHTYHTNLEEYLHYFPAPKVISKFGIKKFVSMYMNRHNAVIAPSNAVKTLLGNYNIDVPITVLPSGINLKKFRHILPATWKPGVQVPVGAPYVMTMSRIGKEKNLEFLVDAFNLLSSSYPDLHFIIAGGGPYEEELKKITKDSPVRERIHMTGFVQQPELFSMVRDAQVFLSASTTETQGLTVLEALASGTPVVAVKGSGVEDTLVGDSGGYLVPENIEKFCEKVSLLLTDLKLREMKSKEAVSRAKDFSIESCTEKLLEIYKL